jgi:hypothetical protein
MKLVFALLIVTFSSPCFAHHNYRLAFDPEKRITLEGTVVEFSWKNPHLEMLIDVEDDDGTVVHWKIATAAPRIATRNGVEKDTVADGETISVSGIAARDGSNQMRATSMTLQDGRIFRLTPGNNRRGQGRTDADSPGDDQSSDGQSSDGPTADEQAGE